MDHLRNFVKSTNLSKDFDKSEENQVYNFSYEKSKELTPIMQGYKAEQVNDVLNGWITYFMKDIFRQNSIVFAESHMRVKNKPSSYYLCPSNGKNDFYMYKNITR